MQATRLGGLNGKARTLRSRNRASRLYTQQLLEEYFGPDPADRWTGRNIPIRSRSDFLPAVTYWRDDPVDDKKELLNGIQLELSLHAEAPDRRIAENESPPASVKVHPFDKSPILVPAIEAVTGCAATLRAVAATPAASPRANDGTSMDWIRPRASFQPVSGRKQPNGFDLNRFFYGCLLGGAAAAVFLLMVSVVFG